MSINTQSTNFTYLLEMSMYTCVCMLLCIHASIDAFVHMKTCVVCGLNFIYGCTHKITIIYIFMKFLCKYIFPKCTSTTFAFNLLYVFSHYIVPPFQSSLSSPSHVTFFQYVNIEPLSFLIYLSMKSLQYGYSSVCEQQWCYWKS